MYNVTDKTKKVIILGAGGTGGWLTTMLNKLDITKHSVTLIDGDLVEPKNISRQAFTEQDINKNKAEVLGIRNNFDFITEFVTDTDMLSEIIDSLDGEVPLIVGCLDNNGSRKLVHDVFKDTKYPEFIWVDAGNAERNGQVYVAVKEGGEVISQSPLDLDSALTVITGDERRPDEISCAEQSISAPQNVAANMTSALLLFNIINNIIDGGLLLANKFEFDTRTISFANYFIKE